MISIIIPILNEEKYIKNCLDSIIESDFDKNNMEVLLVDGGSKDKTINIIKEYQEKYLFFKLLHNPKKFAPMAINIGIKESKGDFIFIISAHASYSKDYFSKLVKYCKELEADCVGPVLDTEVKNKTFTSNAIKNVLSDKLGVGSSFRSGVDKIKEVDTVPFGCYKRDIFDQIGLYDERLIRNQDIELNKRIINNGGKIYLIPDIKAIYYARETFKDLVKNNFENGKWNLLTAYFTKRFSSLSIRHFIPMFFVLSVIIFGVLSFFNKFFFYMFLIVLLPYLSIISFRSWQIKKETKFIYQFLAFILLHFSYGIGSIIGVFEVLRRKFERK